MSPPHLILQNSEVVSLAQLVSPSVALPAQIVFLILSGEVYFFYILHYLALLNILEDFFVISKLRPCHMVWVHFEAYSSLENEAPSNASSLT